MGGPRHLFGFLSNGAVFVSDFAYSPDHMQNTAAFAERPCCRILLLIYMKLAREHAIYIHTKRRGTYMSLIQESQWTWLLRGYIQQLSRRYQHWNTKLHRKLRYDRQDLIVRGDSVCCLQLGQVSSPGPWLQRSFQTPFQASRISMRQD